MSWDPYVDNLTSTGQIDKACIWGNTADSDWTATAKNNFKLDKSEVQKIAESFSDKSDIKKVQTEGITAGGVKYLVITADDTRLHAKKGKQGILVFRTKQALVIGHYPEGALEGNANVALENISSYLIGIQY